MSNGRDRRRQSPPAVAKRLLEKFASGECRETIVGDLEEYFHEVLEERGPASAARAYWSQSISACGRLASNAIVWRMSMLQSYLVLALRTLRKDRVYSFINISGLALGLACSLLIALWVVDEMSYDRYQEDFEDIYRVVMVRSEEEYNSVYTPILLAEALENDLAPVANATLLFKISRKLSIRCGDRYFLEDNSLVSDNRFFRVFDVDFVMGSPETALGRPETVVLSESAARKYFGAEDPMGGTMEIMTTGKQYEVTGVFRDCPSNSHLQYDMIFTYEWRGYSWGSNSVFTYVKLAGGQSPETLGPLMTPFIEKNYAAHIAEAFGMGFEDFMNDPEKRFRIAFQPLASIHLDRDIRDGLEGSGDITYIYIFSLVAFLILLIACVNFVNLSTARAGKRAKEVGIRKVVGAGRTMLVRQFLFESVLSSTLSFLLSAFVIYSVLPRFNELTGKSFTTGQVFTPTNILVLLTISLISGLLAGAYPAFYLSSFRPALAVKPGQVRGGSRNITRDALVVFQYAVATTIFLCAFVIFSQSKFLTSVKLGFDKDRVLIVHRARLLGDRIESFMQEVSGVPGVASLCNVSTLPSRHFDDNGHRLEGEPASIEHMLYTMSSDANLVEVFGLKVSRGRFFSEDMETDMTSAVVINETAVRELGLEDPVGKRFFKEFDGAGEGEFVTIVGVLEDFNFSSLHNEIEPMIVRNLGGNKGYYVCLRLDNADPVGVVEEVREVWSGFADEGIFEYSFLDDDFDSLYRSEMRTGRIMSTFFVLSIVIACLGLFGLVSYSAEQRTKEIGIRKVLGASISDILVLLSSRIALLVVIANVIAWPVSYIIMDRWLDNFAYRTDFHIWLPALSAFVGLALAFLTVSYRAVGAARANPVENIRYE